MKRYKYLISYSYTFNNVVFPGRIVLSLYDMIKDEKTLIEIEKHIREVIDKEFEIHQKDALHPKTCGWLGVTSFQLLDTMEVIDIDEQPINIIAL